jgi:5-methylcytosine-specific restriction endonuclease McrA
MTWENQGTYWEIDHIKPIDLFDLNDENQLYEAFHYTNTQPLHWKENREKSNKF